VPRLVPPSYALGMDDSEADIIRLFDDPPSPPGEAMRSWADRLRPHLDERKEVEFVRHRRMPSAPWPPQGNPVLGYLIDRTKEIVDEDGLEAAIVWAVVHAWFEGAVEERFRIHSALLHDKS
jgi:hypothetical protein